MQTSLTRRSLLAALLALSAAPALAATAPLVASAAWIRWLPSGLPAAGYLSLSNPSEQAFTLVGASSPYYRMVMLHQSVKQGDTVQMQKVDRIVIPPHGQLEFKPGSYHLMLMQQRLDVAPGQRVPVTLKFADGSRLKVDFEVRKSDASGPDASGMHGMDMSNMPGMDSK